MFSLLRSKDTKNLEFLQPVSTNLERIIDLEINTGHQVYRIPYNLNHVYFTHDFWLDANNLIVESTFDMKKEGETSVVNKKLLCKIKFPPKSTEIEIMRISPSGMNLSSVCLSHNKKFLVLVTFNKIVIVNTVDFRIIKEFSADLPKYYTIGQASLTLDDQWLLYPVNLNCFDQNSPAMTEISTYIVLLNLKNCEKIAFGHKSYPWMWSHILCNPVNNQQVTSALVKYTKKFPKTSECHQRLWLWNIAQKSEITQTPLYNQKKKRLFPRYENITHESWAESGEYLTFISRRSWIKKVDIKSKKGEVIMNTGPNPWHCDGKWTEWVVFDTMNKDTGIWVAKTDNSKIINLCLQHTTLEGQMFHPHPIFSPDHKYVIFNADINGVPNIIRVNSPF